MGRMSVKVTQEDVRLGARINTCYAAVYLDGIRVYTPRSDQFMDPLFDLSSIPPQSIEAIELYAGPTELPSKYSSLDATCGLMVIHTRK